MLNKVEKYKLFRKEALDLNTQLASLLSEHIPEAAKVLGVWGNNEIIFEKEQEGDFFFDYALHKHVYSTFKQTFARHFRDSKEFEKLNETKKTFLNSSLQSTTSLFSVYKVDKANFTVQLFDVFDSYKKFEIIDLGFSQSLKPNKQLLGMTFIPIDKFGMTSGATCIFDNKKFKK